MAKGISETKNNGSLESKLWQAADKLRKNMDAAEYKHIVLGFDIFKIHIRRF